MIRTAGQSPYISRGFRSSESMEDDAVGHGDLDLLGTHYEGLLFGVHSEEGHGIVLVVQRHQMSVIREQGRILGIESADGQTEYLFELAAYLVDAVKHV